MEISHEEIQKILTPSISLFTGGPYIWNYTLNEKVVGLKNVTINEPFFQGHFPGKPIMPGVLIVEAMAKPGGFWPSNPTPPYGAEA